MKEEKPKKRIWPTLITLSIIALTAAIAILSLPRGFPSDFSIVGKGTNAMVLIYDPNVIQSTETASMMNEIRDDYEGLVEFIIIKIGTPTGRMLGETYGIETTTALLFDGDGKILQLSFPPQNTASLRHNLDLVFKLGNDS